MGSTYSPDSWAPYYTYRDCSQGICSLYCPQWCNLVYPPPDDGGHNSPFNFSPLIIAVIGVLSSAILLIAYYLIVSRYCRRRRSERSQVFDFETNQIINHDHYQANSIGLDESTIKSIAVFKYKKGDGLVEGTECSVCLSEFQENEDLRLLPKCNHSFHILCIDTWLKSHSSCPLCRANVVSNNSVMSTRDSSSVNVSSLQVHREDDASFVVENGVERVNVIVSIEGQQERSSSLSVADILRIRDDYEDIEMGIGRFFSGVGSSQGDGVENLMKNDGTKRSNFSS